MDERQTFQESFIKLHPVPKTHLFMKKITRIQAIDRQIRKKWIKIKRQNQKQNLTTIEEYSINTSKKDPISKQTQIDFEPNRQHTPINQVQNSLKRQKILNNHKRNQQIFYGRRDKNQSLKNQSNINLTSSKIFTTSDNSRRKIKTQIKSKDINQQTCPPLSSVSKRSPNDSSKKYDSKKSTSLSIEAKKQKNIPFMLEKIKENKKRQREILTSQSEKQLIELSTKSKHFMKQWASQRKDLFQKLKGSKAYYIMKSPTRLSQAEDVYIF